MGAPKGNKFWMNRSKHGRDRIFATPEAMLEAAYEYFDWNLNNPWLKNEAIKGGEKAGKIIGIPTERPMSIEGLTMFWGTTRMYLDNFEKSLKDESNTGDKSKKDEFLDAIAHIRDVIRRQKLEGATVGVFVHSIVAKELGLIEKKAHEHTGKDGEPIKQEFNITLKL